jgi:hypothetical protein
MAPPQKDAPVMDSAKAEQDAGKQATEQAKKRLEAEQDAGKKLIQQRAGHSG